MRNKKYPELGFTAQCKKCATKATLNARNKRSLDENKAIAYNWYHKNKEYSKEKNKKWMADHLDFRKEYISNYRKENPQKMKKYAKARLHRNHKISKTEWESCKEYFNYSCAYCGMLESQHMKRYNNRHLHKEHVDHLGSIFLNNCVTACYRCNSSKRTYDMQTWYRKQDFFDEKRLGKIIQWINVDCNHYMD